MKIFIKVKTGAKVDKIEKVNKTRYNIWVKAQPIKGQANKRAIQLLSSYIKLPQSAMKITSGLTSSQKTIKIF